MSKILKNVVSKTPKKLPSIETPNLRGKPPAPKHAATPVTDDESSTNDKLKALQELETEANALGYKLTKIREKVQKPKAPVYKVGVYVCPTGGLEVRDDYDKLDDDFVTDRIPDIRSLLRMGLIPEFKVEDEE